MNAEAAEAEREHEHAGEGTTESPCERGQQRQQQAQMPHNQRRYSQVLPTSVWARVLTFLLPTARKAAVPVARRQEAGTERRDDGRTEEERARLADWLLAQDPAGEEEDDGTEDEEDDDEAEKDDKEEEGENVEADDVQLPRPCPAAPPSAAAYEGRGGDGVNGPLQCPLALACLLRCERMAWPAGAGC